MSAAERKLIFMPEEIKDVLIGIVLGDAHILRVVRFIAVCLLFDLNSNLLPAGEISELTLSAPLLTPVLVYYEPKAEKASVLTDNKGKSGVYK